jgi:ATP-dependent RNA helicase DDX3X
MAIQQTVLQVEGREKRRRLVDLLTELGRQRVLIFVGTKRTADELDDYLFQNKFPCTSIHGDRSQIQRENALDSFKRAKTPILVATDVAARGLDIPAVSHVVVYDMPNNIDDYVHR